MLRSSISSNNCSTKVVVRASERSRAADLSQGVVVAVYSRVRPFGCCSCISPSGSVVSRAKGPGEDGPEEQEEGGEEHPRRQRNDGLGEVVFQCSSGAFLYNPTSYGRNKERRSRENVEEDRCTKQWRRIGPGVLQAKLHSDDSGWVTWDHASNGTSRRTL